MQVRFLKSAPSAEHGPVDEVPEVCLVGRSNVGKSSLINAVANEKLAITSKTPGRTRMANFYDFKKFRLVDLPGFGFSKTNRENQEALAELITTYVSTRNNLRMAALVVDCRNISEMDSEMIDAIKNRFSSILVIANKADTLKANERRLVANKIAGFLRVSPEQVVVISAKKRENIKPVLDSMLQACA